MYIVAEKYLVTADIFDKQFVCNLDACKGACCWEGDFGAPLEEAEVETLKAIYPIIKDRLTPAGQAAIEEQGVATHSKEQEGWATALIDGGPCAFIHYEEDGRASCGIEKAHKDGIIDYLKPVSCHLYPIRTKQLPDFLALNYDHWDICSAACSLGEELKVPVYQFLKGPLTKAFGQHFYEELEAMADYHAQTGRQT